MSIRTSLTLAALVVAASPLAAQGRGNSADKVPRGHLPPAGMCRIWVDGVPPGRQPAPTDCATARRRVPYNARVVYGDRTSRARDDDRWTDRILRDRDGRYDDGRYDDGRQDRSRKSDDVGDRKYEDRDDRKDDDRKDRVRIFEDDADDVRRKADDTEGTDEDRRDSDRKMSDRKDTARKR
ncbi:MAG TPA: hypothetical protein VFT04_08260 [Gemmatimonadales bacterium]|nr:hypothetical protein [Gemmatimonadales bacterium]